MSLASQLSFLESSTSTLQQINNNFVIASNSAVSNTTTGALQITNGGLAVGGSAFIGGIITATTYYGTFAGTIASGVSLSTATNIAGGTAGQIHYQSGPGVTTFAGPGTAGQLLMSAGAAAPVYTNTASIYVNSAVNAQTLFGGTAGQLHYQSGVGVTAFVGPGTAGQILVSAGAAAPAYTSTSSIYVQDANVSTNVRAGTAGQLHYQSAPNTTAFMGPGTAGQLLMSAGAAAPTYTNTASIYVNSAVNAEKLLAGTAMSVVYQSAASTTAFLAAGSAGQLLQTNGTGSAPTWVSVTGLTAGNATTASNIAAGTAGQIHYQSAPGITAFAGPGTAGQILVSAGTSAPAYTNTSSIYVQDANVSTNVRAGTAGQLVYQSAANTSGFVGPGTAGQLLVSAGAAVPVYTNTSSIYVGAATSAAKLLGGTDGQLVYQTSAGVTGFAGPGTAGQILLSNGISGPVYTNTASIYVNSAVNAQTLFGGAAMSLNYQSAANTTAFLAAGTAGQILQTNGTGSAPTWVSASGLTAGIASQVSTVQQTGNANYFPAFVDTNNASATGETVYTTSSFYVNPSNGLVSVGALTVTGNLTVSGTTTYVNSTVTNISDPIMTIGGGVNGAAPTADDNKDRGIAFQWHNGTAAKNGFFGFDDSTGFLTFVPDATISNEVVSGTKGAADVNLAGGTTGQLVYQSAANTTAFMGPGTAGQLLVSGGTAVPVYTNTASIYVNSAVNSEKLFAGTAMSLVYQSAASTTAFLAAGTAGQVLQTNGTGSAPTWVNASGLTAGIASQVSTIQQTANANYFLTFVDTNNASATGETVYTTSSFTINPSTGAVAHTGAVSATGVGSFGTGLNGDVGLFGAASSRIVINAGNSSPYLRSESGSTFGIYSNGSTAATGGITISTSGKLGVGVAPSTIFETEENTTGVTEHRITNTNTGANTTKQSRLTFRITDTVGTRKDVAYITALPINQDSSNGDHLTFWTRTADATPTEKLRITNNGGISFGATGTAYGTSGQILQSNGDAAPTWVNASGLSAGSTTAALTMNNGGSGAASGTTFNGSTAQTISYNTIGASPLAGSSSLVTVGTVTAGTWNATTIGVAYGGTGLTSTPANGALDIGNGTGFTRTTLTAGTGIGVSNGAGSITISNSGVTSIVAGSNVSINQATGAVTISVSSVPTATSSNYARALQQTDGTSFLTPVDPRGTSGARGTDLAPNTYAQGLFSEFKNSGLYGVSGNYAGLLTYANWVGTTASTGDPSYQLLFSPSGANATANPSLRFRAGIDTTWGTWGEVSHTQKTNLNLQHNSLGLGQAPNTTAGALSAPIHFINRNSFTASGLSWYSSAYTAWSTYMAPAAATSVGPTGNITAPSGTLVTSWALRNFVENPAGYGFTWESGTSSGQPTVVAEILASNGSFRSAGNITAAVSLGVGTAASGTTGEIRATNEITAYYSDRRLKENVKPIDNAVSKVLSLNGITYTPNDLARSFGYTSDKTIVGLFADEVDAVLPEAVRPAPFDQDENGNSKSGENYQTIQYEKLVPLLVEAIKEQQQQIAQLQDLVKSLVNK